MVSGKRKWVDLKDIKAHNCNLIVHTFSENDLFYYPETMTEIVKISHQEGFETYLDPWGVGNIFGGEVLLTVISFLVPLLAPIPFLGLELFVGFIQALVFAMLTAVFFALATSHAEH